MSPKVHLVGKTNVTPSNIIFLKAEATTRRFLCLMVNELSCLRP
jgi:hypothetical protein